jgi:YfiH family protein
VTQGAHWIQADWAAPPGITAGCSLRTGGVSSGKFGSLNLGLHVGDDPVAVNENRERFVAGCGLPSAPLWLSQVHRTRVARDPEPETEADASVTSKAGLVLAVMVADCLPVLFASDDGTEVAAAHAGWRGLSAGVLENTVRAFDKPPRNLVAWLGPAISQAAFEVGDEVRQAFIDWNAAVSDCFVRNDRDRWQADLYGLARQRLQAIGVQRISGGEFCTYADAGRFFSYRRDGQCGRMAAFVFRSA